MNSLNKYIYFSFIVFFCVGCQKGEIEQTLPNRTVIVYMIADNNLDAFSVNDINEIEKGWSDAFNGNLIVYVDRAEGAMPSHPVVYKIEHDTCGTITSKIVQIYPEQNSANPSVMNTVLSKIITDYPAQSYGLVLWSHGTAWFPSGIELNKSQSNTRKRVFPITKSFAKDGTDEMNIIDLNKSLPIKFQFVIFDACYMGSVEVLYELKNKADYIISSSTEVLSSGYPYTSVVPLLYQQTVDYSKIADTFYQSYQNLDGVMQSATISVVNTSGLSDLVQSAYNIMYDSTNLKLANYNSIQQFTLNNNKYIFDLSSFVHSISDNKTMIEQFDASLKKTVIYKASTQKILDELIISNFSGLSVFIPNPNKNNIYEFYMQYQWYKDSNYDYYFNKFHYNN